MAAGTRDKPEEAFQGAERDKAWETRSEETHVRSRSGGPRLFRRRDRRRWRRGPPARAALCRDA